MEWWVWGVGRGKDSTQGGSASATGASETLLGLDKGLMAGDGQATNKVEEFLEIKLPVAVEVQLLHHAVKDAGILLVLQR